MLVCGSGFQDDEADGGVGQAHTKAADSPCHYGYHYRYARNEDTGDATQAEGDQEQTGSDEQAAALLGSQFGL